MMMRLALAGLITLLSSAAFAQVSLVFGTYTSEQATSLTAQLRPALDAVARRLSDELRQPVTIRLQIASSYDEGVNLVVNRRADFMRLGPASYVAAKEKDHGISLLAVESIGGKSTFNGVIAVHRDSEIRDMRELKGRSFAFGSTESTLGRYFAQQRLLRAGIRADDLVRFAYLEQHDKVGLAVGSGLFDAGALEETMFRKLVEGGTPLRAITTYPNVTRPWIARGGLDPKLGEMLRKTLLSFDDRDALKVMRFDGFLSGREADFEPTRQAMAETRTFDKRRH